ncbi:MAG: hypothetical protein KC646_10350 [Candidatus Cloacimonetes bacterium]|nr:hypothetical protein [Candidatus Cloacimonadota bacterium]
MYYTEEELNTYLNNIQRNIPNLLIPRNPYSRQPSLLSLFPQICVEVMLDFLIEEINELEACMRGGLWTASTLMAFRIFEDTIHCHVEEDLNIKVDNLNLKSCIDKMKKSCNPSFVDSLHKLRMIRNKTMHPEERFTKDKALDIILQVCDIVMYVYAIEEDDY